MSKDEKGYWLVTAVVSDPEGFQAYTQKAGPVIAAAGALAQIARHTGRDAPDVTT